MNSTPYIYLRALRQAEHTVFAVQEGQKTYRNLQFNVVQAYASGQQVKRCILNALTTSLNVPQAPITFNWQVKKGKKGSAEASLKVEQKEAWSACDPSYVDQLIGGYMRAEVAQQIIKRRSPLSISAMRPLHPLLGGLERTPETLTFDRSDQAAHHPVRVRDEEGQQLSEAEVAALLAKTRRSLPKRIFLPGHTRAGGLFVYDVCVDLRTLFCVSTDDTEPALTPETKEALLAQGWTRTINAFGPALLAPAEMRERIMPALAAALLNWRITSNQSRTFSLLETLAVAISPSANEVAGAIRAQLRGDAERPTARPVLDTTAGANLFVTLAAEGYIANVNGQATALSEAEAALVQRMQAFDYAQQLTS